MQNEARNETKKPESAPRSSEAKKELSDAELASIAAGKLPPRREPDPNEGRRTPK